MGRSAGNAADLGLIPGLERSPGEGKWLPRISWTEEPSKPQSMGSQKVRHH